MAKRNLWKPYRLSWYDWRGVEFRERMSGARNVVPKKQLSDKERQRREWRERKGFRLDKSKPHWKQSSRKTWCKVCSNRIHRRWERRQIHKAEWDNMIGDVRKWSHDPWMWD